MKKSDNKTLILTIIAALAISVVIALLGMAFFKKTIKKNIKTNKKQTEEARDTKEPENEDDETHKDEASQKERVVEEFNLSGEARPSLLSDKVTLLKPEITADTEPYTVAPDLSNIYNKDLYYFTDEEMKLLSDNLFYVDKRFGNYEFFEVYESNRYDYESNFVTVDSLMHTYHLYFSHLLKTLEKNELANLVSKMSEKLLAESDAQYIKLRGTKWEDAAKRNVEFFAIGTALQGGSVKASFDVSDVVEAEISKINAASGIEICEITNKEEDYTQYIPRGYYEGDEELEKYFRTMMWYGRIQFNTDDDEMLKSSILMNIAMNNAGIDEWKDVYDITAFFAGTSDDLGYYEYYPLITKLYGDTVNIDDIINKEASFETFKKEAKSLRLPQINSIPIYMGENNTIQGFRLMGQRFTLDAAIMQQLIFSKVEANPNGELRMLPDVLDVAAALGSDKAYELLEEHGDTDYVYYKENMNKLKKELSRDGINDVLGTSLYGNWLNTLRPLLTKKGEGYPSFMQSDLWTKRDIECFAGSYTELKHDTILYAKQVMAEMGSGDIPEFDDRGYVQPEPEIYARFVYLSEATANGLMDRGRISSEDYDNLKKLSELAASLRVISEKELRDEVLSDEEYDLIREYGGNLEHFWYDVTKADTGDSDINTEKYQAALVVDVATDPNGQVLEMATGQPSVIFVVVNVDGKIKIAKGSVYSFYQFPWPMSDRLTDSKWRQMMGYEPSFDGYFDYSEGTPVDITWWTKDYSYVFEW